MYLKIFFSVFITSSFLFSQPLKSIESQKAGFDTGRLKKVDQIIQRSITDGVIPGAVLLISRNDVIVYQKAYGYRQLTPQKKEMTVNTVFDMASITKPVATATSAMVLIDRGAIRLLDRIVDFIPEFIPWQNDSTKSKEHIRLIHLLTHTSGLPPYAPVKELERRYGTPAPDSLIAYIATVQRHHSPGTYFKYSCLNFITLQRVIEITSKKSLSEFSKENIFAPLGMKQTGFKPNEEIILACAPTEFLDNKELLQGKVHDPLARVMMDCVSGNAGLFSTADDLAVFASMMLNEGLFNGKQILSQAAVRTMTEIPLGFEKFGRALGWDLHSAYSSNIGDLFGKRTYAHTGYTGTSIVIDPDTRTAIVLLTNRVHPDDKGSVVRLRSVISNVVAGSIIN